MEKRFYELEKECTIEQIDFSSNNYIYIRLSKYRKLLSVLDETFIYVTNPSSEFLTHLIRLNNKDITDGVKYYIRSSTDGQQHVMNNPTFMAMILGQKE